MKKIIILLITVFLSGCKDDFLNRSSLTRLDESSFWLNERDAQLGLNSVYDVLQDRVMYSGNLNSTLGMPNYDALSDNVFNNVNSSFKCNLLI
jgi:starch-binding outer membrane protein, SusD/RagB family